MYTVLLVDDEEDVLKNILNTIDWPVYGVETILTACDGLDAWVKLNEQHVDLLITDISMPNMNGIQLIRKVHEAYPQIRCILLSSYSDFTYAREAISLGVENYLLKPFKTEELENSIRKSLVNISMHKHVMQTLFLDNILYRWVTDDISPEELSERSKHIGVNIYFRNYCVALMKPTQKKSLDKLLAVFFSSLKSQYDVYHFINYDGYHVIILGGHTVTQQFIVDSLQNAIKELLFDSDFQTFIGNIAEGCEETARSYQSALECMLLSQHPTGQHIALANKKSALNLNNLQINLIIDYLKMPYPCEENNGITDLYHEIFPDISAYSLDEINVFIDMIPVRLALQLGALGQIDANAKDNIVNNSYHFEEIPTEEELLKWFANIISICQALIKKHTKCLSPIILLAMQYITDYYSGYVSIKDFCNRYNMNASYLGLLFKKETGIYFNDYINQVRINCAIRLIKGSNLKVSEICRRVGFANSSYFISCFKKQTGVSPVRFRQLHTTE